MEEQRESGETHRIIIINRKHRLPVCTLLLDPTRLKLRNEGTLLRL